MKVSPGAIPGNVSPGTPSIGAGILRPCQWMEVETPSRLATAIVTSSPSRSRRMGPGMAPLTTVAVRRRPVMFTARAPISRPIRGPRRTAAGAAQARVEAVQRPAAPATARPWTKARLSGAV